VAMQDAVAAGREEGLAPILRRIAMTTPLVIVIALALLWLVLAIWHYRRHW